MTEFQKLVKKLDDDLDKMCKQDEREEKIVRAILWTVLVLGVAMVATALISLIW